MVVKVVAAPCLQWSQPSVSTSASPTMSTKKRSLSDVVLACRSAWLGTMPSNLRRSRSFNFNFNPKPQRTYYIRRTCSASFDSFSDEEFSRKIQDLSLRFQLSDDEINVENIAQTEPESESAVFDSNFEATNSSMEFEIQQEPPDWVASIEMKANGVDLPLPLRMIKHTKNKQCEEGFFLEAGESAGCSVKKAFSSMVFIIRELHSYTFQMRELLFYEDLKGILARVRSEIHASFVWLFQQIFSHTPTLMVYVMILLANFTVHSMSNSATIAASAAIPLPITAAVDVRETSTTTEKFDSSVIRSFSIATGGGKTASVGGGNDGGGKTRPVASGMDGDGWVHPEVSLHRPIVPDGVSAITTREEEIALWNSIVEEASRIRGEVRDESLDGETLQRFVSPVIVKIDMDDDYEEYLRTELVYQTGLAQQPNNALLLANYAQFLYLVAQDYDRAEEYFKRAIRVEPKDAEAHNKYANFLWKVRNDLWAAEETFLEAISAEPTNSFYAANYAHFLWNTGGEDTCFPLNSPDDDGSETLDL